MLFPLTDEEAPTTAVQAFMDACIANNEIFTEPVLSVVGAEFIYRRVTPVPVA
jgi:hypothetical protein